MKNYWLDKKDFDIIKEKYKTMFEEMKLEIYNRLQDYIGMSVDDVMDHIKQSPPPKPGIKVEPGIEENSIKIKITL